VFPNVEAKILVNEAIINQQLYIEPVYPKPKVGNTDSLKAWNMIIGQADRRKYHVYTLVDIFNLEIPEEKHEVFCNYMVRITNLRKKFETADQK